MLIRSLNSGFFVLPFSGLSGSSLFRDFSELIGDGSKNKFMKLFPMRVIGIGSEALVEEFSFHALSSINVTFLERKIWRFSQDEVDEISSGALVNAICISEFFEDSGTLCTESIDACKLARAKYFLKSVWVQWNYSSRTKYCYCFLHHGT